MEEIHDNFREDEDEYRRLKRDLKAVGKNCRALQFKLKKGEKSITALTSEKSDLDLKVQTSAAVSSALDIMNQIRELNMDNTLIINSILNR